jgi:hypothetical protein
MTPCTLIIRVDFTFVTTMAETGVVDRIMKYIHDENGFLLPSAIFQYFNIIAQTGIFNAQTLDLP